MRRISTSFAVVLSTLLVISICSAQQTSSSDNKTINSGRDTSPIGIDGPVIGGDGTPNYIPIWATPGYLLSSVIYQDSTGKVGIATTTPMVKLDVHGAINTADAYRIGNSTVLSIGSAADQNLFVGVGAGVDNEPGQGIYNVFLGDDAGSSNTTGEYNVFSGFAAGELNTSGLANTFIGTRAGVGNTSGNSNTYIGASVGHLLATGSGNTFIGIGAALNNTTGNNNIYVGNPGCTYPCTEDSTIRIGGDDGLGYGPQTAAFILGIYGVNVGGVPVQINSNGQLGAQTSSLRFKEQVRDMGDSTSALMKLRPVTFLYRPEYADGERTLQYGLIAEEVAKVYPELVAYDKEGQPYSVRYQYITTMLLNEVQKQYHRAEAEAKVITTQEQKIDELEQRLSRLEDLIPQTIAQK